MTMENTTIAPTSETPSPAFSGARRARNYVEDTGAPSSAPPTGTPSPVVPADTSDAGETVELGRVATSPTPPAPRHGVRGLLNRLGVGAGVSRSEAAAAERAAAISEFETTVRQATWTRAVSVLVANPKGGAGKTPTALVLGGTFASIRGGSVCIVETSDDAGTLTYRAEGTPRLGLGELIQDIPQIGTAGQLAGYTAPQTSFASVLGTAHHRPPLTADDVCAVATTIDAFYSIRVMDSGNQTSSSAFAASIDTADVLVVPTLNSGDTVSNALELIRDLRGRGGHAAQLADQAVVLRIADGRPESSAVNDAIGQLLAKADVRHCFTIPYDQHIAERGQITHARLTSSTREAFIEAAATITRALQESVR